MSMPALICPEGYEQVDEGPLKEGDLVFDWFSSQLVEAVEGVDFGEDCGGIEAMDVVFVVRKKRLVEEVIVVDHLHV